MSEMKIPIKNKYSENFQRIFVTGAMHAGTSPHDFRLIFFRDHLNMPESPQDDRPTASRELLAEIILTRLGLKELTRFLNNQLKKIEEQEGEIKLPKKPREFKPPDEDDSKAYG